MQQSRVKINLVPAEKVFIRGCLMAATAFEQILSLPISYFTSFNATDGVALLRDSAFFGHCAVRSRSPHRCSTFLPASLSRTGTGGNSAGVIHPLLLSGSKQSVHQLPKSCRFPTRRLGEQVDPSLLHFGCSRWLARGSVAKQACLPVGDVH